MTELMKLILAVTMVVGWTCSAMAFDGNFYAQLSGGSGLLDDADNSGPSGTFILESEPGVSGSVSLGYALADSSPYHGGRVEIEGAWRKNGVDTLQFAEGEFSGGGDTTVWSLLVSSYGERRSVSPWTPYIGAGIGIASISLDSVTVAGAPLSDDDDLVLAYQIGGGVDFEFSPGWALDVGYRYFGTTRPSFKDATGEEFDGEYGHHSLVVGVRASF